MPIVVLSEHWADWLRAELDTAPQETRREEVWDGVTYILPECDNVHDWIAGVFYAAFWPTYGASDEHALQFRINLSDRDRGWKQNYRIPDLCLFLAGSTARERDTHWVGGPDFLLEVVSPNDKSRDKLDFYARIRTREVLIVDRDPWAIELYRLDGDRMKLVAKTRPGGSPVASAVVPFTFQLLRSRPMPRVRIVHAESGQEWLSRAKRFG